MDPLSPDRLTGSLTLKGYSSTRQLPPSVPVPRAIHSPTSALKASTSQGTRTSLSWLPRCLFPPLYSSWDHANMIMKHWKTLPYLVLGFRAWYLLHAYLVLPSRCLPAISNCWKALLCPHTCQADYLVSHQHKVPRQGLECKSTLLSPALGMTPLHQAHDSISAGLLYLQNWSSPNYHVTSDPAL